MEYLKRAIELSKTSFEAGEFPAGAVLVSKNGTVYESSPSLPHNHGEMMVIDKAIEAEGVPLNGAIIYASMQPCLMCVAKMYWSGVESVEYVIPKDATNTRYAYEDMTDTAQTGSEFFKPVSITHVPELQEEAIAIYSEWVAKIEGSS
ncbi:MAG: guaD1 [Parcubacteria group bacterium]|nr:guaD1 [Parcubacteria group bacterium]